MSLLPAMMLTLTLAVIFVVVPRIYADWLRCRTMVMEEDYAGLCALLQQENGWVLRHAGCALLAVALVVAMKSFPALDAPESLAGVTAGYAMVSFAFAMVESLLAQQIAPRVTALLQATKERN